MEMECRYCFSLQISGFNGMRDGYLTSDGVVLVARFVGHLTIEMDEEQDVFFTNVLGFCDWIVADRAIS